MTPAEFAGILDQLESAFNRRVDDRAIRHWRDALANMSHDTADRACQTLIRESKFMPSLAEFRAACAASQPREPYHPEPSPESRKPAEWVRQWVADTKEKLT